MKQFEKDTGTIKPNETGTSIRGPVKLFARDTGTVKANDTDTSVKSCEVFLKDAGIANLNSTKFLKQRVLKNSTDDYAGC